MKKSKGEAFFNVIVALNSNIEVTCIMPIRIKLSKSHAFTIDTIRMIEILQRWLLQLLRGAYMDKYKFFPQSHSWTVPRFAHIRGMPNFSVLTDVIESLYI